MIRLEKCPLCSTNMLVVLDIMQVEKPENITREKIRQNQYSYSEEQRWIFFEKIWHEPAPAILEVTLCHACGFIFTNPRFSANDIQVIYQTINELDLPKLRRARNPYEKVEQRARRIFSMVNKQQKQVKLPLKILDYGGMYGHNLVPFAKAGYDCNLLDFLKLKNPPGIKYLGKDLCDLKPTDQFDVIMILHVLEHTIRPLDILQNLVQYLTKGGLLYVEVPKECGGNWRGFDEPTTHINFFSEESIFKLVRMVGMDIVHLSVKKQWIYASYAPSINIFARKQDGYTVNTYRTTQQDLPFAPNWRRDIRKTPLKTTKRILKQVLGLNS